LSVTSVGHKYDYGDNGNHNWKDVHCLVVNDTTTSHHHNTAVDVCAPGYEVISTNYWHNVAGYNSGKSGTSYAAPIVTGIAAMVRTVNPNLTAAQTMQIIKETADASIYDITTVH
jgi:subtilisin family serine protease